MARICPECKQPYQPKYNSLQSTCSATACMVSYGKKLQQSKNKAFDKKVRENDRSWHLDKCQEVFNKFIRLRDKDLPCISCGITTGQMHSSHYRSRGAAPELRYCEDNAHKSCSQCNSIKSGNILEYRIALVKKIGLARVEWIEGKHEAKHYKIDELKLMIKEFRVKIKQLTC